MSDLVEKVRLAMEAKYLPFVNVPAEDMDAAIEAAIATVLREMIEHASMTDYRTRIKYQGGVQRFAAEHSIKLENAQSPASE